MNRTKVSVAITILISLAGCAGIEPGYRKATTLEAARVLDVQRTASSGSWGPGAAIGGVAGVLSGGGHSTESKVIRGAGGALIGAAINKALTTGNMKTTLVVQTANGQMMQIDHHATDLAPGDCVVVQTRSDGQVNIQRTSATQCQF